VWSLSAHFIVFPALSTGRARNGPLNHSYPRFLSRVSEIQMGRRKIWIFGWPFEMTHFFSDCTHSVKINCCDHVDNLQYDGTRLMDVHHRRKATKGAGGVILLPGQHVVLVLAGIDGVSFLPWLVHIHCYCIKLMRWLILNSLGKHKTYSKDFFQCFFRKFFVAKIVDLVSDGVSLK